MGAVGQWSHSWMRPLVDEVTGEWVIGEWVIGEWGHCQNLVTSEQLEGVWLCFRCFTSFPVNLF